MDNKHTWKYPPTSNTDLRWGLVCYSSGHASIEPGQQYPPKTAIEQYTFNPKKGRVIFEYQVVYIAKGQGTFFSKSSGVKNPIPVKAGDAFVLFPGEWHTYKPDKKTGWVEYWIDFVGPIPDMWVESGLISKSRPVFHPGVRPELLKLFIEASGVLDEMKSSYQQALCGICMNILCRIVYYDRNRQFEDTDVSDVISYSRSVIENNLRTINAEQVSKITGVGSTKFRTVFKNYTGITVGAYIFEMRMGKAKELLEESSLSIKEIAYECGFQNADYFSAVFKKETGESATIYRRRLRESNSVIKNKED